MSQGVGDTMDELAEQAHAEVMACIGCHDCMLACPLPETGIVTIAELNDAIYHPRIDNPNVVRFVTACTQCRQCVPACPADLSRADMVLFNKMKVEDTVPDHVLMMQIGQDVAPSCFTLDSLAGELTKLELFKGVAAVDLRRMMLSVTLRQLGPGEVLCEEGHFHERLYIVLSGLLEQSSGLPGGQRVRILVLTPGSFFGELAIMAEQPEPFGVHALESAVVLEIPKAAVHRLMQRSGVFSATMGELYRRRALWSYLKKPGVLGALPEQAMAQLAQAAELVTLGSGDTLFEEGSAPGDVYLVRTGFLRVSRRQADGDLVLTYFREGDLFGVLPLLWRETANTFSVRASSRSDVIRFSGQSWLAVVGQYPDVRSMLESSALGAEHIARQTAAGMLPSSATSVGSLPGGAGKATVIGSLNMDSLVQGGLAQGSEVLVVDQNRCVSCHGCIDACARRHGNSRLELQGLQLDNLLFPTACRHCEDPKCLLCSVNGIQRLPGGEITIVEENCVGCGACADRCPYGNIRMHPVDAVEPTFVDGLWAMIKGAIYGSAPKPVDPHAPRRAVKCDLCAGYEDYACVTACPVGAAFRTDPQTLIGNLTGPIGLHAGVRNL